MCPEPPRGRSSGAGIKSPRTERSASLGSDSVLLHLEMSSEEGPCRIPDCNPREERTQSRGMHPELPILSKKTGASLPLVPQRSRVDECSEQQWGCPVWTQWTTYLFCLCFLFLFLFLLLNLTQQEHNNLSAELLDWVEHKCHFLPDFFPFGRKVRVIPLGLLGSVVVLELFPPDEETF